MSETASGAASGQLRLLGDGRATLVFSLLTLVTLIAFESYAITTALPVVATDLSGEQWAPLAFAGTLTTSLIGMTLGGMLADRAGTFQPLLIGGVFFVVGVLLCVIAPHMWVFILGRLLQGVGGGMAIVVLYVVIAREFPPALHSKMFGMLSAAWLIPAFIGPLVSGFFVEQIHWRALFGLVTVIALLALGSVLYSVRGAQGVADPDLIDRTKILWAILAALAALSLHLAGQQSQPWNYLLVAAGIIAVAFCAYKLLPKGTLRARTGVPRLVLLRALFGATVAAADVYVPLYLQHERNFTPTLAGLIMALVAIGWATASFVQGRVVKDSQSARALLIAAVLALAGPLSMLAYVTGSAEVWVVVVGNFLMGTGMGTIFPQLATIVMRLSTPRNQGANGSALQTADALGSTTMLALTAAALTAFASAGYAATYLLVSAVALLALALTLTAATQKPRVN